MKRLAIFFTIALAAIGLAQPMMGPSPSPGNMILKVDVVTNLQQMRPDISDKLVVLILGTNTIWDGGAAYYRADPTNELPHSIPTVITSSVTTTGRWIKITELTSLTTTNSVTNIVYVTNEVSVSDVPEYYAMLSSYDEFGTYAEGDDFSSPTNNAHGWASAWEVASGSVYITNRWPTNYAPATRTNATVNTTYGPHNWMRSDSRLILAGNNTEIRRKFNELPSDWQRIRMGFRFTPLWRTNTLTYGVTVDALSWTNGARMGFGFYNSTNGGFYDSGGYWVGALNTLETVLGDMIQTNELESGYWQGGYLIPQGGAIESLDSWKAYTVSNQVEILSDLNAYDNISTSFGDRLVGGWSADWWLGNAFLIDLVRNWVDDTHLIQVVQIDAGEYDELPASFNMSPELGQILSALEHPGPISGYNEGLDNNAIYQMHGPYGSLQAYNFGSLLYGGFMPARRFAGVDGVSLVWNNGDEIPLEISEVMLRVSAPSLGSGIRVPTLMPTNIVVGSPVGDSNTISWNNDYSIPNEAIGTVLLLSLDGSNFGDCSRTNTAPGGYGAGSVATGVRRFNKSTTNDNIRFMQSGTWSVRLHYYSEGGLGPPSETNTWVIP